MKAVLAELGTVAAFLLIAWTAVGPGRDGGVLVPPPEAVAENFLKAMAQHRYTQAGHHLTDDLKRTDADELAELQRILERARGPVAKVQGEDAVMAGRESTARASIQLASGRLEVRLPMRREHGLWKIAGLGPLRELATAAAGESQ